jgi:cytochrome bd-type quinol oxidase subunit 2
MQVDLSIIWALIIGFSVMMYVLLDGFDLGVGILFLFVKKSSQRSIFLRSITPVWDGNETWLVLGGSSLLAAFPMAYAFILSAFYLPIILFLIGLILRGIAIEFHPKESKIQYLWDYSFAGGSFLATFMQGIILGRFVEGFAIDNGEIIGQSLNWWTPFSVMTGCGLIVGYALLGSTWLIMKTHGLLQEWCRSTALKLMFLMLIFIITVSIWTPIASPEIAQRWFSYPNILYFMPVPLHTAITAIILYFSLRSGREYLPFICSIGLFFLSYTGLVISLWPYIVPRVLTIWQAASAYESQLFTLIGVLFLLPIILLYTVHSYWVFRGKVGSEEDHY